ncbi:uncharacterized protein [Ambystoma mexicanum]|uniref:uncharacterized protein n=1 Tax=Ambystoma mexicanum TaxID=8296 RepID=UPI0037E70F7C
MADETAPANERKREEKLKDKADPPFMKDKTPLQHEPPPDQDSRVVDTETFIVGDETFADDLHTSTHLCEYEKSPLAEPASRVATEHPSSSDSLSNDSSHRSDSIILYPSLSDFQKVSAVLIEISGSSASLSGLDNAQDTDVSDSEVFGSDQQPAENTKETQNNADMELLPINRSNDPPSCDLHFGILKERSELQDPLSEIVPFPKMHMDASHNVNQMHDMSLKEEWLERVKDSDPKASGDFLEHDIGKEHLSHHISNPQENVEASSGALRNSIPGTRENYENCKDLNPPEYTPGIDKSEKNLETKSLSSDSQPKVANRGVSTEGISSIVEPEKKQLGKTVRLAHEIPGTRMAPLASESEDISLSDDKTDQPKYLNDQPDSCKSITGQNLKSTSLGELLTFTEARASSECDDFQVMTQNTPKKPSMLCQNLMKSESKSLPLTRSKDLFPHINNMPSQSKDDLIFINDEVLLSIDEDTLSEILSPLDEVLSYGSSEFPSTKKDRSCQSDDLPSFPDEASIQSDDLDLNHEDFPSPPEELRLLDSECPSSDKDELNRLPLLSVKKPIDNSPLQVLVPVPVLQQGDLDSWPSNQVQVEGEKTNIDDVKESSPSYLQSSQPINSPASSFQGQTNTNPNKLRKKRKPFLTLSTDEDSGDKLISFEIGDRVLVKHTQPGTLRFKGETLFDDGYWAGVALDKPEGGHDGTYEGVKYFECANHCGVFAKPHEISHLLEDKNNSIEDTGDEDSFSDGPAPKNDYGAEHQATNFSQQTAKQCSQEKGKTSVLRENQNISHRSVLGGREDIASLRTNTACIGNYALPETFSEGLVLDHDLTNQQCASTAEECPKDAVPLTNEEKCWEKMTNKQDFLRFSPEKKEKLTDELCSHILRELLCDTLNAFSATSRPQHKFAFVEDCLELKSNSRGKDVLLQETNDHTAQTPPDALPCVLWDVGNYKNPDKSCTVPGSEAALRIGENIVAKFIDDAMKEYKKIKRKQGWKEDGVFRSSQCGMPFLRKILDAGVFGDPDYLDQPLAQPAEELLVPKVDLYGLERWCTAQWKEPKELPLVVPHNAAHVKQLVMGIVEDLWVHHGLPAAPSSRPRTNVCGCETLKTDALNTESENMYNQVIYDVARELLEAEWPHPKNARACPWEGQKVVFQVPNLMQRKQDLKEMKSFIEAKMLRLLNLEGNDLETKWQLQKLMKFGSLQRDRVDVLLIQELHQEEEQWTDYTEDELTVKMKLTDDILESLVDDTIDVLGRIHTRKAHV